MNHNAVDKVMTICRYRLKKANISIESLTCDEWSLLYLSACKEYIKIYSD